MTYDFAAIAQEMKTANPSLVISHGPFVTSDDVYGVPEKSKEIYG